ncbi:MAG: cytochrome c [Bdellovibrionota bacterium]
MKPYCTWIIMSAAITWIAAALNGCGRDGKSQPPIYMPDMVYSPALKAQEPGSMRMPVSGTIPRDFEPYPYAKDPELAGIKLRNTLTPTAAVLERGRSMYNVYCIVCHGPTALGDGTIVPKFPRPPSLHSDKVNGWLKEGKDGRIYHIISSGQNLMPSYASQISRGDRWAIVHYLRTLLKAGSQ